MAIDDTNELQLPDAPTPDADVETTEFSDGAALTPSEISAPSAAEPAAPEADEPAPADESAPIAATEPAPDALDTEDAEEVAAQDAVDAPAPAQPATFAEPLPDPAPAQPAPDADAPSVDEPVADEPLSDAHALAELDSDEPASVAPVSDELAASAALTVPAPDAALDSSLESAPAPADEAAPSDPSALRELTPAPTEPVAVQPVAVASPEPPEAPEAPAVASAAVVDDGAPLLPPSLGDDRIVPLRMTPLRLARRPRLDVWGWLVAAMTLILLPGALAFNLWPAIGALSPVGGPPDRIPRGASEWSTTTTRTPLNPDASAFGSLSYPVDPQFAGAYALRGGESALGPAITPAFECNLGLVQFFAAGALLHETHQPTGATALPAGDLDPALARAGVRDDASGDVWLPLSQALLSAGSAASVGAANSATTYITLRDATQAIALVNTPASAVDHIRANAALPQTLTLADGAFVVEGSRGGKLVGHAIPAPIWQFIQQPQIAPEGWLADVGAPLTEAIPITSLEADGATHHLLAQAFWQTVVVTDLDSPTQATWLEPVGLDYLHTLGAPNALISAGAQRWTTQDGALRVAAGASGVAISLNTNAPVTLTGATKWQNAALWYAARWSTPNRDGDAWVAAGALTATRPTGMLYAGIDALSPSLASYLAAHGDDVGVVAYDITRNTTYSYNSTGLFTMASSAKVPLMITYLTHIESLGRGPNSYELSVLTAMIEHSDNNAAQVIYDTLGDQSGQQYYLRKWGIYDYTPNVNGWGWCEWSPGDMAHLLTLLYQGKVLNSADRALAFHLMRSIESDQRFGVGDTAPSGANVAMKDGWVPEPDGWWAVNTSGIVIVGSETYIVTVYTRDQASFGAGQAIVNHVAGAIGQALT